MMTRLSDKEVKKKMQPIFHKDYNKHYPTKTLKELGYERYKCENCDTPFWSRTERKYCGEPICSGGYRFIGKKLTRKQFSYRDAWKTFSRTLEKHGYTEIRRYPVVSRWYDELYFTTASINCFQPYVVRGEAEPPANPLVIPQFCLRFPDIEHVGMTGRHYTGFIMPGQHAFNTAKQVFTKEKALHHIFDFIVQGLGIDPERVIFQEDIWAGGGNFGPALEYFSEGLELGNQVYMDYTQTKGGYEELENKVLDHGGGLERYAWFSQGTPTSYDAVFPHVLEKMYKQTGIRPSRKWHKVGKYVVYFEGQGGWKQIAEKTGYSIRTLEDEILPIRDLYVLADHSRALLFAMTDGALPSNVGGGHNIRNILRRCFYILEKRDFDLSVPELLRWHLEEIGTWFTELQMGPSLSEIIQVEKERYKKNKRKARKLLEKTKAPTVQKMIELYDTHGIQPETMRSQGWDVPDDFYERLDELHEEQKERKEEEEFTLTGVKETKKLYYENEYRQTFQAKVIDIVGNWLVLDKTLFYPGGGGQEGDKGTIEGKRLLNVKEEKGVVLHKLDDVSTFEEGQEVRGKIDWNTRYSLMKNHTAAHLINWAARKTLGQHVWQAGAKKAPKKARLDITHFKTLSFDTLQEIEQIANQKVQSSIEVEKRILPRTKAEETYGFRIYQGGAVPGKELRIVKTGEEVEACGGTHVDNTAEIGLIKITSSERIQDGVVRLEYVTDGKAFETIQTHEQILESLSDLWDVPYEQLYKTGKRFFNEWKARGNKIDELENEIIDLKVENALREEKRLIKVEVPGSFGKIAERSKQYIPEIENAIILIGENYGYGVSANEVDVKQEMEKLFQKVEGNEHEARGFKKR